MHKYRQTQKIIKLKYLTNFSGDLHQQSRSFHKQQDRVKTTFILFATAICVFLQRKNNIIYKQTLACIYPQGNLIPIKNHKKAMNIALAHATI